MTSSQKTTRKDQKMGKNDDAKTTQKQLTLDASITQNETGTDLLMLTELRKFREESGTAQRDILESQSRMEASITEIKKRIDSLEERLNSAEERVSNAEDRDLQQGRVLAYLLKKDAKITAKLDDMENRMRRNNIRVYGIKEDSEGKEMIPFIKDFLKSALKLPDGMDICIERAHRATVPKPKSTSSPRSMIVRFLDFNVKQLVLQCAWKQRNIEFRGNKIFFDQDYSTEVQRKRKQVREVIKKLKERNIKAQSPYPAQLRLFLEKGVKTFSSLLEAQSTLKELGIPVEVDERDVLERELLHNNWQTQGRRGKADPGLDNMDIRAILNSVDQHKQD